MLHLPQVGSTHSPGETTGPKFILVLSLLSFERKNPLLKTRRGTPHGKVCFSRRIQGDKHQSHNYRPGFLPCVGNEQRKEKHNFCALFELCLRSGVPLGGGVTLDQERETENAAASTLASLQLSRDRAAHNCIHSGLGLVHLSPCRFTPAPAGSPLFLPS